MQKYRKTNNMKDWNGNRKITFTRLGASNHTDGERAERDYYATDPVAAEWLLKLENIPKDKPIWEPACGELHLSRVFMEHGYTVRPSDIIARCEGVEEYDFLTPPLLGDITPFDGTIITNPPYNHAQEFITRALATVTDGNLVCMFLRTLFLESKERRKLFDTTPPHTVWQSSSRISCYKNGDNQRYGSSATAYAWFVWVKGWTGDITLKFFN